MRDFKLQVVDRRIQDHELRRELRMLITYILFLLYINYVRVHTYVFHTFSSLFLLILFDASLSYMLVHHNNCNQ